MAFKILHDTNGGTVLYSGDPSAELLLSVYDVRDVHDNPVPGSLRDRLGIGAGVMSAKVAAGTYPSAALVRDSARVDAKLAKSGQRRTPPISGAVVAAEVEVSE